MQFTDDDIAKWKKEIDKYEGQGIFRIFGHEILALLSRLEAAENVCDTIEACLDVYTQQAVKDSLKAWRKAVGKDVRDIAPESEAGQPMP